MKQSRYDPEYVQMAILTVVLVAILAFAAWATYAPLTIDGHKCFTMLGRVTC